MREALGGLTAAAERHQVAQRLAAARAQNRARASKETVKPWRPVARVRLNFRDGVRAPRVVRDQTKRKIGVDVRVHGHRAEDAAGPYTNRRKSAARPSAHRVHRTATMVNGALTALFSVRPRESADLRASLQHRLLRLRRVVEAVAALGDMADAGPREMIGKNSRLLRRQRVEHPDRVSTPSFGSVSRGEFDLRIVHDQHMMMVDVGGVEIKDTRFATLLSIYKDDDGRRCDARRDTAC